MRGPGVARGAGTGSEGPVPPQHTAAGPRQGLTSRPQQPRRGLCPRCCLIRFDCASPTGAPRPARAGQACRDTAPGLPRHQEAGSGSPDGGRSRRWPRGAWAGRPPTCGGACSGAASEGRPGEEGGYVAGAAGPGRRGLSVGGWALSPGRPAVACLVPTPHGRQRCRAPEKSGSQGSPAADPGVGGPGAGLGLQWAGVRPGETAKGPPSRGAAGSARGLGLRRDLRWGR